MILGLYSGRKTPIDPQEIIFLREKTKVGSYVKFDFTLNEEFIANKKTNSTVEGFVEEVYPRIFKVDGKYYQWVDYARGFIY